MQLMTIANQPRTIKEKVQKRTQDKRFIQGISHILPSSSQHTKSWTASKYFMSSSQKLAMISDFPHNNIILQRQEMTPISKFFLNIKLLFLLIDMISQCQQHSPLRLGGDSQANDIRIIYSQPAYFVVFKQNFQYLESDFTFCLRERPVLDKSDTDCELGNSDGPFDCITYSYTTTPNYKWRMSSDFSIYEDQTQIYSYQINNQQLKYGFSFSLSGEIADNKKTFSLVNKSDIFYEVISATSASVFKISPENVKRNFMSTFYSSDPLSGAVSDNLLMQRQAVCFKHNQIYHVLFLGGVVRDSKSIYMNAIVSYDNSGLDFKMWAGLSYSSSHASRDMVGIDQMFGNAIDLFSLYASAPFQDTSSAIKGKSNYVVLANSGQHSSTTTWVYYIQFYRSMQTGDTWGDETLRFKIKNKYCFVSYSQYSQQNFTSKDTKMFLNKNFMHQHISCFFPDLTLDQSYFWFIPLILGCFLMIFLLL